MIRSNRRCLALSAFAGFAVIAAPHATNGAYVPPYVSGDFGPGTTMPNPCTPAPPSPAQNVSPERETTPMCAGSSGACNVDGYLGSGGGTCPTMDPGWTFPGGIYKDPVPRVDLDPVAAQVAIMFSSTYNGQQGNSAPTCAGGVDESLFSGTPHVSDGFQGKNWFQNARPELIFHPIGEGATPGDALYLVASATNILSFRRVVVEVEENVFDPNTFVGTNGNTGVIVVTPRDADVGNSAGDNFESNLYTFTDRNGMTYTFFGDYVNPLKAGIAGQLWKVTDASGATAHVGTTHSYVTAADAISAFETEWDAGLMANVPTARASTLFDSSGHKFTIDYATVGSVDRITSVEVEIYDSGWKTLSRADYTYYTTLETVGSPPVGIGDEGDLKTITTTTYLSPDGMGDPVTTTRTRYHRYYTGDGDDYDDTDNPGNPHQIKMILGPEGVNQCDINTVDYFTEEDANLYSYADSVVTYYDADLDVPRIKTVRNNGECGCGTSNPNGLYSYEFLLNPVFSPDEAYVSAGVWSTAMSAPFTSTKWYMRSIETRPDGSRTISYLDEFGQYVAVVQANGDPTDGATDFWVTRYEREAQGRVSKVFSPESIASYVFDTDADPMTGNTRLGDDEIDFNAGEGLVQHIEYYSTDPIYELGGNVVTLRGHSKGETGAVYVDEVISYLTTDPDYSVDVGQNAVSKPLPESVKRYKNDVASSDGTGLANAVNFDETTYAYTFYDPIVVESVIVTEPIVDEANNGSDAATTLARYMTEDGRMVLSRQQDGRFTYYEYDSTTSQLTEQIQDVGCMSCPPTTAAGLFSVPPSIPASGINQNTAYTYDPQGRAATTTLPSGRVMAMHYTKLSGGEIVTLSIPRVEAGSPTTYYGPVSYSVGNHGGKSIYSGILTLAESDNETTTAPAEWIDTAESELIAGVQTAYASVVRVQGSVYNRTGARLNESRAYTVIPGSLPGAVNTNYDATFYGYDDMGRTQRVLDATGTITRTVYDLPGRVIERWMGTDDTGLPGSPLSGTSNMTKLEEREYDGGGIGNSNLTSLTRDADGSWGGPSDQRVTTYIYDYRNRPFMTENPESPHSLVKYDNRNRVIASAAYSDVTGFDDTTDPAVEDAGRLSLSETSFDERGQVWRTKQYLIVQSTGAPVGTPPNEDGLVAQSWYDSVGRLIKTAGTSVTKYKYDTLGRQTRAYTLAQVNDAETYMPAQSEYEQAGQLDDDIVLEESQTLYDDDTNNVLASIQLQRHHDNVASRLGALDKNSTNSDPDVLDEADLLTSSNVHARAQITAMWYDELDRLADVVQLGTYGLNEAAGNNDFDRDSITTAPTRSNDDLCTTTTYNKDGTVLEVTDPRGLKTQYRYDDAGRQIAVISNYVDETPSGMNVDDDNYVRYEYDNGLMVKMWVDLNGDGDIDSSNNSDDGDDDQVTEYVYGTSKGTLGTSSPVLSQIATGHLLREAIYPPQTFGQPAADRTVHSAYNALSEQVWTRNQNDTIIVTNLDNSGREVSRVADAYGTGVSEWVQRVELTYTDRGQVEEVIQYDEYDASLNEVKYHYDDWGNIEKIEQDRDSKLGTAMTYDPYVVEFTHSLATPAGGRQRVQRDTMLLPYPSTGYEVEYLYEGGDSSPTNLDGLTGRVTGFNLNGSGSKRVAYQYLGAGDLVGTTYPEFSPGVGTYRHTNVSNAAYDAFDRFNRVVIDRWNASNSTPYRLNLAYDPNSNITWAEDPVITNGSSGGMTPTLYKPYTTKYTMDGLNRVITADRGQPSGGTSINGNIRLTESWALTQTGNWLDSTRKIDSDGNVTDSSVPGVWTIPEFEEDRSHSNVNEILGRELDGALVSSTPTTYKAKHDEAGQMIDDGKDRGFQYDAFGRLVEVRKVTGRDMSGDIDTYTVLAEYRYDGLGQRIAWHRDFDGSGNVNAHSPHSADPWVHIVYDDRWRMVALFNAGDSVTYPKELLIPHNAGFDGRGGSSYIDSYAVSEFDGDGRTDLLDNTSDGSLQTRRYYLQNWRADVVTLIDTASAFAGWYKYSAYGQHQWISTGDIDDGGGDGFRNGGVDINDLLAFLDWFGGGDLRVDQNGDGGVDINDLGVFGAGYDLGGPQESRVLYAGYAFDPLDDNPSTGQYGLYHVRHRVYSPELGRWARRDPIGYGGGISLQAYTVASPYIFVDPLGLQEGYTVPGPMPVTNPYCDGDYTFDFDTSGWDNLTPALKQSNNACEMLADAKASLARTGKTCFKKLVIAGHGSPGLLGIGSEADKQYTPLMPAIIPELTRGRLPSWELQQHECFRELLSLLCPGGTLTMVFCNLGDATSKKNRDYLIDLLPPGSKMISHKGKCWFGVFGTIRGTEVTDYSPPDLLKYRPPYVPPLPTRVYPDTPVWPIDPHQSLPPPMNSLIAAR